MTTIDIRTTQNVTINYELASLQDRFIAMLLDLIIVIFCVILLLNLLSFIFETSLANSGLFQSAVIVVMPMTVFMLYHFICETVTNGQSIGKRIMKLQVVRLDGQKPSVTDFLLRALFLMLEFILCFGLIGAIFIASSLKNQRLGDLAANTSVIRMQFRSRFLLEDILKINTLDNYEIQYPEIKNLSEQDMLLIKSIISRYNQFNNDAHRTVVNNLVVELKQQLDIQEPIKDKIGFLKTLIRDYIVLTR